MNAPWNTLKTQNNIKNCCIAWSCKYVIGHKTSLRCKGYSLIDRDFVRNDIKTVIFITTLIEHSLFIRISVGRHFVQWMHTIQGWWEMTLCYDTEKSASSFIIKIREKSDLKVARFTFAVTMIILSIIYKRNFLDES